MILKEIKYRNFKVKIVKLARKDAKKDNIWGYYDTDKSIIAIQEDIKNITLLDTLLHEIAHMIAHKSKIRLRNLGEEGVASFIGSEFSKIFLQNPKLITFIKSCTAK